MEPPEILAALAADLPVTVADLVALGRWPIKCMPYGDAGAFKSTFAATFPKPLKVFATDPFDKLRPYMRHGRVGDLYVDDLGTSHIPVWHPTEDILIIDIEQFLDEDPKVPEAYGRLQARAQGFKPEWPQWTTVVYDSVTNMEKIARWYDRFKINKGAKDGRQHYAASTDAIEMQLAGRAVAMPMNAVAICHVNEDKDEVHGNMVYNPSAPGKMGKKLPTNWSELYRCFVKTEDNVSTPLMQTRKSSLFNASTQIPAPDMCEPAYESLWTEAA